MKRLFCLLTIAACFAIGCAPSDTGSTEPSDNTSQIVTPVDTDVVANV